MSAASRASATAPAPDVEAVLRRLAWQLLFRGRTPATASGRPGRTMGLGTTLALYTFMGLFPGLGAFLSPPFAFATTLHAITLVFASLQFATAAGTMLFVREEADILLHRPVLPAQLLRAKVWALSRFSLLLAAALNAIGLVTGMFGKGLNVLWLPVHALSTLLLMAFSAAAIVLGYNLCLRFFGRERLDSVLATMQALLMVVMMVGYQLVPRILGSDWLQGLETADAWLLLMPPVWFASFDLLLCGAAPASVVAAPAGVAVAATALLCWLAFHRLAGSYGKGLQAIGEGTGRREVDARRRIIPWLVRMPPLRWWMRGPIERQGFLLASAYLLRDRETKLKIMPSVATFLVIPIMPMLSRGAVSDLFAFVYLPLLAFGPLDQLRFSTQHAATASLGAMPMPHWAPLFHGCRKACLLWIVLPAVALLTGILVAVRGSTEPVLTAVAMGAALPAFSMVPGLMQAWLPLSQPTQEMQQQANGCLVMGVVLAAAGAIAGIVQLLQSYDLLLPGAAAMWVVSLVVQRSFARTMAARPWDPTGEALPRRRVRRRAASAGAGGATAG